MCSHVRMHLRTNVRLAVYRFVSGYFYVGRNKVSPKSDIDGGFPRMREYLRDDFPDKEANVHMFPQVGMVFDAHRSACRCPTDTYNTYEPR